jgi:hypothetical protein
VTESAPKWPKSFLEALDVRLRHWPAADGSRMASSDIQQQSRSIDPLELSKSRSSESSAPAIREDVSRIHVSLVGHAE